MAQMELSEKIVLNVVVEARARYSVFDLSGSLPFDIFYSLARSWPIEADRVPDPLPSRYVDQPLTIRIQESLLDVGFALKYGFLKIVDETQELAPIDFSDLELQPCDPEYITLESGANSKVRYHRRLTDLSTSIGPSSQIGQKFKPYHRYRLVLPNDVHDFPVKSFSLGRTSDEAQNGPSKTLALNQTGHTPRVDFTALPCLRDPPQVTVKLSASSSINVVAGGSLKIRAEILNRSSRAIVVQSRGNQLYLAPILRRGSSTDDRPRITCPAADMRGGIKSEIHWRNLSICKVSTGEEMIREYKETCSVPARYPSGPSRIPRNSFTTLEPGVTLVKEDTLQNIYPSSEKFAPGEYRLTLVPLGAVWFWGSSQDIFQDSQSIGAYPWNPRQTLPVMFSSDDEIVFRVG